MTKETVVNATGVCKNVVAVTQTQAMDAELVVGVLLIVLPAVRRHIKVMVNVIVHATTQHVITTMEIAVHIPLIVLPAVHRQIKVMVIVIVRVTTQPVIMITEIAGVPF